MRTHYVLIPVDWTALDSSFQAGSQTEASEPDTGRGCPMVPRMPHLGDGENKRGWVNNPWN